MKKRKRELDDIELYSAYEKVVQLYENNNLKEAIKEVKDIIKNHPYNPEPYIWLGDLEFELYNLEESLKAYKRAIKLDEQSSVGYSSAARICFILSDFDGAERYADGALNINPEDGEALYLKALLFDRKKNFAQSDLYMKKANLVDPENYPKPLSLSKASLEATANSIFNQILTGKSKYFNNISLVIEDIPDENALSMGLSPLSLSMLKISSNEKEKEFKIIIFKRNLEHFSENEDELQENVKICLLNEINKILSEIERDNKGH